MNGNKNALLTRHRSQDGIRPEVGREIVRYCDGCDRRIRRGEPHYHCDRCDAGNFDSC